MKGRILCCNRWLCVVLAYRAAHKNQHSAVVSCIIVSKNTLCMAAFVSVFMEWGEQSNCFLCGSRFLNYWPLATAAQNSTTEVV